MLVVGLMPPVDWASAAPALRLSTVARRVTIFMGSVSCGG